MKNFIQYKNWYSDFGNFLKLEYENDYKVFSALLASTSPRSFLKKNYNTSKKLYHSFKQDKQGFIDHYTANKQALIKDFHLLPSYCNNVLKSLIWHVKFQDNELILSGLKVNAFYNNLIGNYNFITLDYLMIKFFKHNREYLTPLNYKKLCNKVKKLFHLYKNKYQLNNYAELQAIIWQYQRSRENIKVENYLNYV